MDVNINDLTTAVFEQGYKLGWQHRNDMGKQWERLRQLRQQVAEQKTQIEHFETLVGSTASEIETLREQLAAAGDNAELERLRLEVVKLRTLHDALLEINTRLREQLAAAGDNAELERLRAEVAKLKLQPAAEPAICMKCLNLKLDVQRLQDELQELAAATVYKGNTVTHWQQRATAYREALSHVWHILGKFPIEFPPGVSVVQAVQILLKNFRDLREEKRVADKDLKDQGQKIGYLEAAHSKLFRENEELKKRAGDSAELERLRAFVAIVRDQEFVHSPDVLTRVEMAIAGLDAAAALDAVQAERSAPASEPTGGAK